MQCSAIANRTVYDIIHSFMHCNDIQHHTCTVQYTYHTIDQTNRIKSNQQIQSNTIKSNQQMTEHDFISIHFISLHIISLTHWDDWSFHWGWHRLLLFPQLQSLHFGFQNLIRQHSWYYMLIWVDYLLISWLGWWSKSRYVVWKWYSMMRDENS